MHKRLWTYLFLTLLSAQYIYQLSVSSHFLLNKSEIAATLCENQQKPELQCNGKCYLAKQLSVLDNSPDEPMDLSSNSKELLNIWSGLYANPLNKIFIPNILKETISFENIHYNGFTPQDFFHPPKQIIS
jgi:hypothetical protein